MNALLGTLPTPEVEPQRPDGALAPRTPWTQRGRWTGRIFADDLSGAVQTLTPAALLFLASAQAQAGAGDAPPSTPGPAVTTGSRLEALRATARRSGRPSWPPRPAPILARSRPPVPITFGRPPENPTPPPTEPGPPPIAGDRLDAWRRAAALAHRPSFPPEPEPDPELGDWKQYGSAAWFAVWQRWEQFHFASRANVRAQAAMFDRILPNPHGITARTVLQWLEFWDYGGDE